ncbi:hypothetical protein A2U01_0066159 [Trifolium medium]|uniref:Uncharacterized protein n=1 Tax=Trifolium medium TaxID=97028 RepID=A0A392SAC4_9FABA|nr:hypothetical protein [Trifolium medium]
MQGHRERGESWAVEGERVGRRERDGRQEIWSPEERDGRSHREEKKNINTR